MAALDLHGGQAGEGDLSALPAALFPAGVRVLVVDDDPLCLTIVEQMLRKCSYQGMLVLPCPCQFGSIINSL